MGSTKLLILIILVIFSDCAIKTLEHGAFCGSSQEEIDNSHGCGLDGRCWAWCGGPANLAANAYASGGKWCYTTGEGFC
jgi:hypothetical protein